MIDIKAKGITEQVSKMQQRAKRMSDAGARAMMKALLYTQSTVPPYPPPPAGSKYRLTHILGRSVTAMAGKAPGALSRVETKPLGGVVGYIGTNIVYAPYVIDESRQAWMHRGRWWTLQGVVEKARDKILAIFKREVKEAIN